MTTIASFVFNPFQENTYLLYDKTGECVIIDPGCSTPTEEQQLTDYIDSNNLRPIKLINTHCHVDHIMGNKFVMETYKIDLWLHEQEVQLLKAAGSYGRMFGVEVKPSPEPEGFLKEGDTVSFGESELKVLFTPGHSPGEISLVNKKEKFVIAGDVLFLQSIGRTDLPGGDYDTLLNSIKEKLLPLGDDFKVYSGHGPETTIGFERSNNPFLRGY